MDFHDTQRHWQRDSPVNACDVMVESTSKAWEEDRIVCHTVGIVMLLFVIHDDASEFEHLVTTPSSTEKSLGDVGPNRSVVQAAAPSMQRDQSVSLRPSLTCLGEILTDSTSNAIRVADRARVRKCEST